MTSHTSTERSNTQATTPETIYEESLELAKNSQSIIPFMEDEIVRLEEESAAFVAGERENTEFTPFRLKQGVYGQRQADVQMIRVKIPGGIITTEAMDALGDFTEKYAPLGKGHITTRENFQFHHIPLDQCPDALRLLGAAGLSTREACGNVVRNVVGAPTSGVCASEIFDPTPYLAAFVRFAVRHPLTQAFPRKFKSAFTGCDDHDHVAAAIQDLTFVSQIRVEDGVEKRGFKVFVGGGTSIMPRLAKPLYEFLPEEDFLRLTLAIFTVFNNADMLRKNRMMARLKVLIDKIGLDEFKSQVEAELENIGPLDPKPFMNVEEIMRETPPALAASSANGSNGDGDYAEWRRTNVEAQKQEGYYVVHVKPDRGNISADQFHGLADIMRKHTGGRARTSQEQNLALRFIPEHMLHDVWDALTEIGLAEANAHSISNVVSCPGTDSCKLGITSSMGLAGALKEEIESWDGLLQDEGVNDIRIKMSGCPNGCGLHHIANIGFHGAATKGADGEQIPAYEMFLGGNYGDVNVQDSRIGTRIPRVKIPAKSVPGVLKYVVNYYKDNRNDGEKFNQFLDRVGLEELTEVAEKAQQAVADAAPGSDMYVDWERTNQYKVERGEGECAV
ncbi:MAG: nitrite/sulfite reductase [Chloroflexi bacterium]|nr:nitrite/sulfite reductase [Dehalococcoidia bacterium]RUA28646.1 MAG: nitrite/sulfite reductase [Chloroflexota bacterium]